MLIIRDHRHNNDNDIKLTEPSASCLRSPRIALLNREDSPRFVLTVLILH